MLPSRNPADRALVLDLNQALHRAPPGSRGNREVPAQPGSPEQLINPVPHLVNLASPAPQAIKATAARVRETEADRPIPQEPAGAATDHPAAEVQDLQLPNSNLRT